MKQVTLPLNACLPTEYLQFRQIIEKTKIGVCFKPFHIGLEQYIVYVQNQQ